MVGSTGSVGDSSRASRARTRTISRPLTTPPPPRLAALPAPPCGFLTPAAPSPVKMAFIAAPPSALRRQRQEAQRLAEDVARHVQRLSLLDVFGEALTRTQRWAVRDALRATYLPALALDGRLRLPAATAE